ncbi:MAG: TolC family protein [Sphingobacteriales bacterium]|nr:MAG: TolC family protein [Sphingobacteriales bacterium]
MFAQKTDFDKIVPPLEVRAKEYVEVLIQLAWMNNPQYDGLQLEEKISEEEIKLAKLQWTKDLNASFNLNEANIKNWGSNDGTDNIFFPRYNLSATLNLGSFINRKANVNIARYKSEIAAKEINQAKLLLRGEVTRRYEEYLLTLEIIKIRAQAVEELYSSYLLAKSNMELGKGELKELNEATEAYLKARENKLMAETNLKIAKINIEELIGLKLEEVFEEKYQKKN